MVTRSLAALDRIQADHGLQSHHLRCMHRPAWHLHVIARAQHDLLAGHRDQELALEHRVDLVDVVDVRAEVGAFRIGMTVDRVPQ